MEPTQKDRSTAAAGSGMADEHASTKPGTAEELATTAPGAADELAQRFEQERSRLVALASRILGDANEAQDIVQQAWLRLDRAEASSGGGRAEGRPEGEDEGSAEGIDNLAAWLTTVTTRLCLDRLRRRIPVPEEKIEVEEIAPDPAEDVALADTVGIALQLVLDRLSPNERVAFVMHDSFGFEFTTIAAALDTTPQAARKLASRARAKVTQPRHEDTLADWEVVDAFMAAAREGDFTRLVQLLAPDAVVRGDQQAIDTGTPAAINGREDVASFFNGSAHAALPASIDGRAGSAWYHRGQAMVLFDFTIVDGQVARIDFRADPTVIGRVVRRDGAAPR